MNFCFYIRWLTDQEDKLPESDNEDTIDSLKAKEDKIKVSLWPVGEENQILHVVWNSFRSRTTVSCLEHQIPSASNAFSEILFGVSPYPH